MQHKELNLLFECINAVIRQIRDLQNDNYSQNPNFYFYLQNDNFEAGIVDSVTSNCDNLFTSYEKLLNEMELFDYKIEREINRNKWNITQLEDLYTDINNWKIPDDLELDEEDKSLLRLLIKSFKDNLENVLESLSSN